jgi:hypothetical protein
VDAAPTDAGPPAPAPAPDGGSPAAAVAPTGATDALPTWQTRLEDLAVAPEALGSTDDAGWMGTALGLRSYLGGAASSVGGSEPTVYWGARHGHQVFVRLGLDDHGDDGVQHSHQRLRELTVVRAALPSFRLRGDGGVVSEDGGGAPAQVQEVLATLPHADDVWRRLRITAGQEGIVALRPQSHDIPGGWIHDLWLLELLVRAVGAPPLPATRVGPSWKAPYGLS